LKKNSTSAVPLEETLGADGVVCLLSIVESGADVCPVGQDIADGEIVFTKGSVLGPAETGLLVSLGHSRVLVHPRPRLANQNQAQ